MAGVSLITCSMGLRESVGRCIGVLHDHPALSGALGVDEKANMTVRVKRGAIARVVKRLEGAAQ